MKTSLTILFVILLLAVALYTPCAAGSNRFYFANQSDWEGKRGFFLDTECSSQGNEKCKLADTTLTWAVADGKEWRFVQIRPKWEFAHDYRVKATIEGDTAKLWLDGKLIGEAKGGFAPVSAPLRCREVPAWAASPTDFLLRQLELTASSGKRKPLRFSFIKEASRSLVLRLMASDPPREARWPLSPGDNVTIETTFRLEQYPDVKAISPIIDRYGQVRDSDYPGKIKSDADLKAAAADEERRLSRLRAPKDRDKFGGTTTLGWSEKAAGFFRVTKRNGFWWLISPDGNPCFYVGVCSMPTLVWETTPVTGREYLWEWLPPKTGEYKWAWGKDMWGGTAGTEFVAFHTVNMIRKYGDGWSKRATDLAARRAKLWGFSGGGKWGTVAGTPEFPVLNRDSVPSLIYHPDIFDPAVQEKLRATIRQQIEPRKDDPLVVGWSLGNEIVEIILADEVKQIMYGKSISPAKRALADYALKEIYSGDLAKMATAWEISGATIEDLYAAQANPPKADTEKLRRHYADRYYEFIYRTAKEADPNHLYFGFWIVPGWWENEEDWRLMARHCDVIGYDRYGYVFADDLLQRLSKESDKPMICGEFSYAPFYDGKRGFGSYFVSAKDDADAGRLYSQWVKGAAENPYCVGMAWFQYRDGPVTGRGASRGGTDIVVGECYAFGLVDVGDNPKWPMVSAMRKANYAAAGWRVKANKRQ